MLSTRHTSYGTAGQARAQLEAGEKQAPAWEANGTTLALLIDVAGTYAYYLMLLVCLQVELSYVGHQVAACDVSEGLATSTQILACEYTKGYWLAFPAVATAVLLLLIARSLLQKRLYYGLLRVGGVLQFDSKNCFKDPLVIFLFMGTLHCLCFMCLTSPLLSRLSQLFDAVVAANDNPENSSDANKLTQQEQMLRTVLISAVPIVALTAGAYLSYDIQSGLLPLSQYVQDADDAQSALQTLRPMRDTVLRELSENGDVPSDCALILDAYEKATCKTAAESHVGLNASLWPAPFLGAQQDSSARTFGHTWLVFASMSLVWMATVAAYLLRLLSATVGGGVPKIVHAVVLSLHLVILCGAASAFIHASIALFPR